MRRRGKVALQNWVQVLRPVVSVALALGIGAILVAASGNDVGGAYGELWRGAVGNLENFAGSLRIATTLIFTSLAFTFAFRAGVFNAGTQGQFVMGAFGAAWVGFTAKGLPGPLVITLAFLAGLAGGAIWALGPGLLKERWGVNEIVTSLMLSFVALLLVQYLVQFHFSAVGGQVVSTPYILDSAHLTELIGTSRLTWAIFVAIGLVVVYGLFLRHTVLGYELSVAGSNRAFALYGGISLSKVTLLSMVVSGAIAGLGGAQEILGVHYRFLSEFSLEVGFTGIIASFLGQNRPIGIVVACLFLGGVQNGALNMELFTDVHRSAVSVITALIVMLATAIWPWRSWGVVLRSVRQRRTRGATAQS